MGDLLYLERCESSQDELWARWSQEGEQAPEALYTLNQRAGRGRLGRAWVSPAGACLCLSWRVPKGQIQAEDLWALSFVGGVAVAQLTRALDAPCALKWPNDLLWGARKLAGVLCEARLEASDARARPAPRVVIGVGLNLTPSPHAFPGSVSLEERLREEGLSAPPADQLASRLLHHLQESYALLERQGSASVLSAWRRDALPLGVQLTTGQHTGALLGVSDTGSLLLDTPQGTVSIDSGEVALVSYHNSEGVK